MLEDTPLIMVEDDESLRQVAEHLGQQSVIGVDTESDSFYSYQEKVCLLQVSDLDHDYIIDPLAIDDMSPLAALMSDRSIAKVFHGADYDVVCLKRDYGWEIRGIFDTMIAAQLLGLQKLGLADLLFEFFGVEVDKKYQRHDWSQRPLLAEHILYARGDTHWLLALRELLTLKLKRAGRLEAVEEECEILEGREWTSKEFDQDGYLHVKKAGKLPDKSMRVLKRLYLYRDAQARKLDRPTFKILGDADLVLVATRLPKTLAALDEAMPGKTALKRRHAEALVSAVVEGLKDDFAIPRPEHKKPPRREPPPRLRGKAAERAFEVLKLWRNDYCKKAGSLNPVAVASNSTLKEIARMRPTTIEELAEVDEVRRWQVAEYGETILQVLDDNEPYTDSAATPKRRRRKK